MSSAAQQSTNLIAGEAANERITGASVSPAEATWPAFPAALRLELVLATPRAGRTHADLVEPFVTVGDRRRFSRTLLARVLGPGGGVIREVALEVQSDEYPIGELPGWSNRDVDAWWREQYRLWTMAAEAGAAAQLLDVLPAAADGGAPVCPPTLYCKQRRAFFPAPCPGCGHLLETCQNDELLERHGLPRYDRSLERFLYCRACAAAGQSLRFYALILSDPDLRTRAPVGEQTDLFLALAGLARNGGPLPCAGCARVPTCYPEEAPATGEVTRLLTPLSFYDYRCLPLERFDLHYDQFATQLGGTPDDTPVATGQPTRSRRFLFEDDPHGKLPLEILRLKLMLFAQLVQAVSGVHRVTRLPHLALSPENVMIELPPAPAGVPRFYNFRTQLLGIGSATRRKLAGIDSEQLAIPLLEPPPLGDTTYAATPTAGANVLHAGLLTIAAVSPTGERIVLETELTSDAFDVRSLRPKDAVHVTVRQGRPLPLAIEFVAVPVRHSGGRLTLRSTPVAVDAGVMTQLRSLVGETPLRATFAVHTCVHVPDDVASLGMVLFTTLTANSEQSPSTVAAAARKLSTGIARQVRDQDTASAEDLEDAALAALQQADAEGVFARRQLFARPSQHPDPREHIPDAFWYGALLLGLRALTQVPGFGFCRGHDDFDPEHPEGPVDHLAVELAVLGHNIEAELLGMQGKTREIAEAVARVRSELRPAAPERGAGRR